MSVRRVPPALRLTRTHFAPTDRAAGRGSYTCPACGHPRALTADELRAREGIRETDLDSTARLAFQRARPVHHEAWESFLDFHCAGCGAPVRLVYAAGQEVGMGGPHPWDVLDVLELAPDALGGPAGPA